MNEIRPVYRIEKTVMPGTLDGKDIYITIEFASKKLSITGNCSRSSGQIDDTLTENIDKIKFKPMGFWSLGKLKKLLDIWDKWHLNDMNAGCEHQRALGWKDIRIDPTELPKSTANRDERGIIATWIYPKDHPEGKLTAPCPTCGYKYGSKWLKVDVPPMVLVWLDDLQPITLDGDNSSEHIANTFLKTTKTEMKIEYLRTDKYFDDDEHPRDIYRITLTRKDRTFSFEFGQSYNCSGRWWKYGNYERGISRGVGKNLSKPPPWSEWDKNKDFKEPTAYDILACLETQHPGSFEDFCGEFGYDSDSRKAEKTYHAVIEQATNIERLFTSKEIERLADIQ